MTIFHRLLLYSLLIFLGISLIIPGLIEMFKLNIGKSWIICENIDAKNHLRSFNAMMTAVGLIAVWACFNLDHSRLLVIALGIVMMLLVVSRVYSIIVDCMPGSKTLLYLAIETGLALVFLVLPPVTK